jgi:hypothetical protein
MRRMLEPVGKGRQMKVLTMGTLFLSTCLVVGGCAESLQKSRDFTGTGIPAKEYLVGGGFEIRYTAPADGTSYWVEETHAKVLATKSVTEGDDIEFKVEMEDPNEFAMWAGIEPAKARLSLYFIPHRETAEGPFTDEGIPARQYQVGGGFDATFRAPTEGTAYWVERNSAKILTSRPVKAGEMVQFKGTPEEVAKAVGKGIPGISVAIYFIPATQLKGR